MNISEKDIRDNINDVIENIKKLELYDSSISNLVEAKKELVNNIVSVFDKYLLKEWSVLNNGSERIDEKIRNSAKISFNTKKYDENTINCIGTYRNYNPIYEESLNLYSNTHNDIEKNIKLARTATKGGFGWFFVGKKKKNDSIIAVNEVYHLLQETSFVQQVDELLNKKNELTLNDYSKDFKKNFYEYLSILNQATGNKVYPENDPELIDFDNEKAKLELLNEKNIELEKKHSSIEKYNKRIIIAAQKIAEQEAMQLLKGISVDELNTKAKKIRVSALKNAGYYSIANLVGKDAWRLSSIDGISEDTAYNIVRIVKEFEKDTIANQKIKLTSDNKTKEATELLHAVYSYYLNNDYLNSINSLYNNNYERINELYTKTINYINKESWLIFNADGKNSIVNNCNVIDNYYKNNFIEQVDGLNGKLNSKLISDKDLWEFFAKNSAAVFSILDEVAPGYFGNGDTFYGLPEELAEEIRDECIFPDGLLCTLRRYQEWGVKYILHQKNVLLGDEMGLGKTIQAIATMVSLKNTGAKHFIVVCPASVVINWCREINTHSKLRVIKVHGGGRLSSLKAWVKNGGVAVTTYETVSIFTSNLTESFKFSLLVVDEAHCVYGSQIQKETEKRLSGRGSKRTETGQNLPDRGMVSA